MFQLRIDSYAQAFDFGERLAAWVRLAAAPVDLLLRLALAQGFIFSGLLKAAQFETAIALARYEYPVPWLVPETAALLGILAELCGGLLLAAGLATRAAALALAAVLILTRIYYLPLDAQWPQLALFAWWAIAGAGRISLDAKLARGLARSAVPFAAVTVRALAASTAALEPLALLALRVGLGFAVIFIAGSGMATGAASVPLALAVLLFSGAATRLAALGVVLTIFFTAWAASSGAANGYGALALLLAVKGAGALSVDAWLGRRLRRMVRSHRADPLPRVVIVGAGFGGIECARRLAHAPCAVTLIDRTNFHLFQPLLYQVATTALAPSDIALPIRGLLREQQNLTVLLGEVTGIDTQERAVRIGARKIYYDDLVLATGASHSYFGRDEWAPAAPGLKRLEDATEIRRRVLLAFERAEFVEDDAERSAWLTFIIVGAGPTGVELAGALAELAHHGMAREFRRFDPAAARVVLVQSGPRVLPALPENLSLRAQRALSRIGVELRTDARVEAIDSAGVTVGGQRIAARTVLWAAGVTASPAARWLGVAADRAGRIEVGPDLAVPGQERIYAIGDTAAVRAWRGDWAPGLAPAAKQAGAHVAKTIRARLTGRPAPAPFRYRHLGSLATIGRKAAVADFGGPVRLWGAPAWWLWGAVHIAFLAGMRNRFSVLLDWLWAYLTNRSGTRLILGVAADDTAIIGAEKADAGADAGAGATRAGEDADRALPSAQSVTAVVAAA